MTHTIYPIKHTKCVEFEVIYLAVSCHLFNNFLRGFFTCILLCHEKITPKGLCDIDQWQTMTISHNKSQPTWVQMMASCLFISKFLWHWHGGIKLSAREGYHILLENNNHEKSVCVCDPVPRMFFFSFHHVWVQLSICLVLNNSVFIFVFPFGRTLIMGPPFTDLNKLSHSAESLVFFV